MGNEIVINRVCPTGCKEDYFEAGRQAGAREVMEWIKRHWINDMESGFVHEDGSSVAMILQIQPKDFGALKTKFGIK